MKSFSPFSLSFGATVVMSALLLATAPGHASTGGYYAATPVVPPTTSKLVVRDTLWKCGASGCAATAKSNSRSAIVCQLIAQEVGTLAAFRAGTETFDADALAKCNANV